MKKLLILMFIFIATSLQAIVYDGDTQVVSIEKKEGKLVYIAGKKSFKTIDECAKYCFKRTSVNMKGSTFANVVDIKINFEMSDKDRKALGAVFVKNYIYPKQIQMTYSYKH